jgi:hypothetical protein
MFHFFALSSQLFTAEIEFLDGICLLAGGLDQTESLLFFLPDYVNGFLEFFFVKSRSIATLLVQVS